MIDSIKKLRESSHLDDSKWTLETGEVIHVYGSEPNDPNAVNWGEQWRKIADEIEREIAERYIELPCDADGAPWHIGDVTENGNVVNGITFDRIGAYFTSTHNDIDPIIHTHFKPRTIEDVLADFAAEVENDRNTIETARRYAEEIRELMEVDR